jgi:hypothetical protein
LLCKVISGRFLAWQAVQVAVQRYEVAAFGVAAFGKITPSTGQQVNAETACCGVLSGRVFGYVLATVLSAFRQPRRDKGLGLRQGGARDYFKAGECHCKSPTVGDFYAKKQCKPRVLSLYLRLGLLLFYAKIKVLRLKGPGKRKILYPAFCCL